MQRSGMLSTISGLQASLGEFDAATETAAAIPTASLRNRAQGLVLYWVSRRGQVQAALERAQAMDAPEPRLGALVEVAEGAAWILSDRKSRAEK